MHEKIFDFITQMTSANWGLYHGYWFALVLLERFRDNGAKLMYFVQNEQFAVEIDGKLYNYLGDVTHWGENNNFPAVEWAYWQSFSPEDANRIMCDVFC